MRVLLFLLCTLLTGMAQSQQLATDTMYLDGLQVCTQPDQMPSFTVNVSEYMLKQVGNIQIADKEMELLEARMIFRFIIDTAGRVRHPVAIRGGAPQFNAAFFEILRNMPRWQPAIYRGKIVSSWYTLPLFICFR